ncbi:universal stress protein [Nocardia pneumoniae]|uniref:universal stress protein n=1 Tax=Nocardia pneumoniae TaxID=228601 RepID=UPI0002D2D904|nr:universal stress protein [Nocardia pneumoniae]
MRTARPIVVGVDGSAASLAAVRWAAIAAARRHTPLHLVNALGVPGEALPVLGTLLFDTSAHRKAGESALSSGRSIVRELTESIGDLEVETFLESPSPVTALVRRSAHAELLTVGTRGLGTFERVLLGSVAVELTRHARCPVAIIPGIDEAPPPLPQSPVLVGVDGSLCSAHAVEIAFDEASARRVGVVAMTIWSRRDPPAETQVRTGALLAERLAGVAEKYPDVPVDRVVAEGQPARRLLQEARNAQLLVLGSRGRGGVAGAALGSVSQAVLQGTRIPVIIATRRQ